MSRDTSDEEQARNNPYAVTPQDIEHGDFYTLRDVEEALREQQEE